MTNKTSRNGRQAERQNLKIITLLGTQEHSRLRPKHLVVPIVSVPGFKNWNQLHISVYTTTTKPNAIYPTTGEASSILSRKEDNCYISIVGINSNAPQVAPRTTRGYPTSIAISLTQFFSFSVVSQELVSPGKGGVKEMPVKNDSIIYCIEYTKP